ncbi:MAG: hypothetical protein CVT60_01225 [Actinobacteria bacterium HGW-Actinobacteria-10]|jgi:hypothetical protein|nr:MAG: hypothetical protein CVT60_01225 [Actinobacteria bacterium HGW-Actinobacteria-10]
MVFGFQLLPIHIIAGGVLTLSLLILQILVGTRRIKFKGVKHMMVHRRLAWGMLAVGLVHGSSGLLYFSGVTIP